MQDRFTLGARKRTTEKQDAKLQIKKERRENALSEAAVLHASGSGTERRENAASEAAVLHASGSGTVTGNPAALFETTETAGVVEALLGLREEYF